MNAGLLQEHFLPELSPGTIRRLESIHFNAKNSTRKVYIQAGLHADEAPGYLVACRLLQMIEEAAAAGQILEHIVIVPVANPIGLAQWGTDTVQGRFDNSDHINFNRRYPDLTGEIADQLTGQLGDDAATNVALIRKTAGEILRAKEPASETEALKQLLLSLSIDADIVLDLHCDHEALVHVYMGTPLWEAHSDLSAQMGAGATLLADDSGDTPFDEANSKIWWELAETFPDKPIPSACLAATIELRGVADTEISHTEQDALNLFHFLQRRRVIGGEPPPLPDSTNTATPLEGVDYVRSPGAGILSFCKEPGDVIQKGDVIAEVTSPMGYQAGHRKYSIASVTDGVLFARCADRFARPGKIIAKVAGATPLAGKGRNLLTF